MSEPMVSGKSHDIPKRLIWAAWLKVKSNGGAAGADGVTIEQFEERLKANLFRLWNRMASGSYFPGPVRAVEIPKKGLSRHEGGWVEEMTTVGAVAGQADRRHAGRDVRCARSRTPSFKVDEDSGSDRKSARPCAIPPY